MSGRFEVRLLSLIFIAAGVVAAQSPPPRRDIPSIAKAANGSIVSIVMSDDSGKPIAQGTGFIVSKDGLIVTNYHVIAEGSSGVAKLPDGAIYILEGVVTSNKARDVAVLKIKATGKNFRGLMLGNSDRAEVGQEVVAIGNPLSLESTVSNGIVSGIRTADDLGGKFLQVTAPISPGSSGGPLFNMTGEVIGITTLYLKGGENLNFAIPINDAKRLLVSIFQLAKQGFEMVPDWPNEVDSTKTQEHESNVPRSAPKSTGTRPKSAREYYEELRKAGEFVKRLKAPEDTEWWIKGKKYRTLNGEIYACIPDDTPDSLKINFLTFQAYRYSAAKSAPASPYVQDATGTDMINFSLHKLEALKVHVPIKWDSFEELDATTYVTGIDRALTFYFRQGWNDQEEWLFGYSTIDIREGNLAINSATMRFAGNVPLLGGVYVTGKCEKVFRRAVYEVESSVRKCDKPGYCVFGSAEFDQELREQGIDVRP